jgi:hypothetical protein
MFCISAQDGLGKLRSLVATCKISLRHIQCASDDRLLPRTRTNRNSHRNLHKQLEPQGGRRHAGHGDAAAAAYADPPDDFVRPRLALAMLQASGHYFVHGAARPKLDCFMLFFQRYLLTKEALPADVAFDFADVFTRLQPKAQRCAPALEASVCLSAGSVTHRCRCTSACSTICRCNNYCLEWHLADWHDTALVQLDNVGGGRCRSGGACGS